MSRKKGISSPIIQMGEGWDRGEEVNVDLH